MNELSTLLEKVLPQYQRVSLAPPLRELLKMSQSELQKHQYVMFKSIDSGGNIYLVQNPALMEWQVWRHGELVRKGFIPTDKPLTVVRMKPKLVSKEEMRQVDRPKTDLVKASDVKVKQLNLGS